MHAVVRAVSLLFSHWGCCRTRRVDLSLVHLMSFSHAQKMKEVMPLISNCMAIGDRRKFLSMLVTLKCEVDAEGLPTDKLTDQVTCACDV